MSVLFMMPQWESASEVWMQRMMEGLSQDLGVIVVPDSKGNDYWHGDVRVVSLRPISQRIPYLSRMFDLVGLSLKRAVPGEKDILRRTIRQLSITHIFCQYGTFAVKFMDVFREMDLPVFVHFHGYDATFDLHAADRPNEQFFVDSYISSIRELEKLTTFIVNSEFTRSLLVNAGISPDNTIVKYYGVPIPEMGRSHTRKDNVQVLHLGRLVDFKSPDRTIKAFEIARDKGLKGHLMIGGDGPLKASCELLRLRSSHKESIHLLGSVNIREAEELFSESDIFTQHNIKGEITRQSECLGVSIVEAMAHGLPVVGTKNGGVVETVVDGETGVLVMPGDVESQADAILHFANNPDVRQKMGDNGRAHVSMLFNPQKEAEQLRKILKLPPFDSTE